MASSYAYFSSAYYNNNNINDYDNYQPHFLDSCYLCHRTLSHNSDIFMYRGNTPFCSQECRQEQIEMDEASEKKWKINSSSSSKRSSSSSKVMRSKKNTESAAGKDSDRGNQATAVRTGTVAVA